MQYLLGSCYSEHLSDGVVWAQLTFWMLPQAAFRAVNLPGEILERIFSKIAFQQS